MWVDNFSKILPRLLPANSLELFKSCLWTVFGLFQLTHPTTNLTIVPGVNALPRLLVCDSFISRLRDFYLRMEAQPRLRFDSSISKNLTRVPLGFDEPQRARLFANPNFYPFDIRSWNIGSNFGLVSWLEELLLDETTNPAPMYRLLLCDINIFVRSLRVTFVFLTVF